MITPGSFNPLGGIYEPSGDDVGFAGEFQERFRLSKDDLVIAMTDLSYKKLILGRCEIVPMDGFLLNQRIAKVIELSEDIEPSFLRYAINSRSSRKQIEETATGSTVFHSSADKIRETLICLPPINEQREIANELSKLEQQLASANSVIRESIDCLAELRSALITAAVTGKIAELQ